MSWKHMAMAREEGGLGLRDPQILHQDVAMRRIYRILVGVNLV